MISEDRIAILLNIVSLRLGKHLDMGLCLRIASLCNKSRLNIGTSTYARKRRAKQIGRCYRCYRVCPGFSFTTRCDGKTCYPGISTNQKVVDYILGVTSVIPRI
ncbi:Nucleic acid binding protein [Papaya mild mottle associated virus]|uniref:RNA silencing suppressor n=1 Tax=Papaya mild mottle associated virus TaxID=2716617 RepID=A0AAE6X425_9VIRU|nr:Nucleic acid binding protein [Papaya mild mottle associated virus]QIJ97077.1 Nucleic acid binding protein [Papaya mild mottle associated virus]